MRQGPTWLKIRRGISRRRYLFRCSTTELHGSKPWQESNLRLSESEGTIVFTTGESLCKDSMTCCHSIRAFFSPLDRLHLQGKKQALKFSHRFRGPRGFYKFPRRGFRRLREEPSIQLYLLAIARFSQVKLVVNSSRTRKCWVQFFNMVRRHDEQDASGRRKTIQNVQQPRA
jgi:hypothetical protein